MSNSPDIPASGDGPQEAIAAVVVLYHPDESAIANVESYRTQVDRVFAVDNTPGTSPEVSKAIGDLYGVTLISLGENLGIATALNVGVKRACEAGYEWLLTMDQDSTATPDLVARLQCCALSQEEQIGLVSPVHRQVGGNDRIVDSGCRPLLTAMTSGNLVSLRVLAEVGPFMDELFIDQVDNEMCLRMWRAGYRVVEAGDADLIHRVGDLRRHRFPYPAYSSNHSAVRRYYIVRNRLAVADMFRADYPEFGTFEKAQIRKDLIKILLYETGKVSKFTMMWRGYRDYRAGRLGPYKA